MTRAMPLLPSCQRIPAGPPRDRPFPAAEAGADERLDPRLALADRPCPWPRPRLPPRALPGPAFVLGVLCLAGVKAHLILTRYLGLSAAPAWARGFDLVLVLLLALFAVLALAA
jgi:hypothetical protein